MKHKVKITGRKVHEVGYRVFLLRKALELGVERFNAYNTKENGMQVLIAFLEGNKGQIAAFQEFANENEPEDAEVSDRVFEDYEGYVIGIADYMHLIQVEQLSKGIPAILSIDRKQDRMLEKQDKMLEKQDKMLEKQDKMLEKQDKMLEKQDAMLEKQDTTIRILERVSEDTSDMKSALSRIEIDVKDTKFSLSSFIEEKFRKQEVEIAEVKAALARMQAAG
jgi:acylphosphatase